MGLNPGQSRGSALHMFDVRLYDVSLHKTGINITSWGIVIRPYTDRGTLLMTIMTINITLCCSFTDLGPNLPSVLSCVK